MRLRRLMLVGILAGAAAGQGTGGMGGLDAKEFTARSVARLALLDLRLTTRPTEDDYRAAAMLLSFAHELAPDDAEIVRRWIQAVYACGDGAKVLELTREVLRLDPSDTVSQLRLITASISQNNQTAEDRLAAYERFLDPKGAGKALDGSVLSRLALDAALLLRERGDDAGFIKKLTQATQLDSTHKEAAQLAATVFAERRPDDRLGWLRMLENLLMADPVDPNVHLSIARELAAGGAYKAARRFENSAGAILTVAGASGEALLEESFVLRWRTEGPSAVVSVLNKELADGRAKAEQELRRLTEKHLPTEKATKPGDVRLSGQLRMLYIIAMDSTGDAEGTRHAVDELGADVAQQLKDIKEAAAKNPARAEALVKMGTDAVVQLCMARLWTGLDTDAVEKDLKGTTTLGESDALPVMLGWLAARQGKADEARRMLEPSVESVPFAALGLAVNLEVEGKKDEAKAAFARLALEHPLEVMGAWAAGRAGAAAAPDAARVAALEGIASEIPLFIDRMAVAPQEFQRLTVKLSWTRGEAVDRTSAHVTMQNMSDIALAVGTDRPLSTRLLLSPKVDAAQGPVAMVQPDVIDVDRRLRLKSRETLEADVWPDAGQAGWLLESLASRSTRVRWRVVQGFQVDPKSGYHPGVMGLTTETDSQDRLPLPECLLGPAALSTKIANEPGLVVGRLAAAARGVVLQSILSPRPAPHSVPGRPDVPAPKAETLSKEAADAFAARYPKLPAQDRAMLAAVLPHAKLAPELAPVDQVMRAETETLPLCVILATRVTDPADELLTRCQQSDDPRVKEMAVLVAARLTGGNRCYAKLTPVDLTPVGKPADGAEAAGAGR